MQTASRFTVRRVEQIPAPNVFDPDDEGSDDIGEGLTETELAALVAGFERTSIYPVVVLAAASGARRNELLALRWSDLDAEAKTLRIERAAGTDEEIRDPDQAAEDRARLPHH